MKYIVKRMQRRKLIEADKPELTITFRNKQVEVSKVRRWMKDNGVSESLPYSPESVVGTFLPAHQWTDMRTDRAKPLLQR
jgi:hypothetical protein